MKYSCIGLLILACACMKTLPKYEYSDGNANLYRLSETKLEYVPVKPEESSSGVYSGGEPRTISITADQCKMLQDVFEKAIANTDVHLETRPMMSGLVSIASGTSHKQVILKPGCTEMTAIEKALKELFGR